MGTVVCHVLPETPAGAVAAVSAGFELLAVEIGFGSRAELLCRVRRRWGARLAAFGRTEAGRQLREYFRGARRGFDLRVRLERLSPFRRAVLEACAEIPFGRTLTYAQLARAAGSPRAARAAGQALAENPCPIVIPCHRVVAAAGPGGFSARGGLETKRALLSLEAVRLEGA